MTVDHSPIASPCAGEESPESPRFSGLNLVWVGSVPLLVFMFLSWRHRFGLVDDAYIPMVYARNLMRGLGLVFRPGGGAVEGFTSPLWTAGLTLGEILCIPLPTLAWLGSVGAGMGLLFLSAKIVPLLYPTLSRKESHIGAGFAALLLASDFTYVGWSASGLETSAYALAQMGLLYSVIKPASPRTVALTLLILALLRPEGICLLLPCLGIIRWQGRSLRPVGMAIFYWLALPYAAFLVWRYTNFGYWLPNTFYAKHGFGGWPLLWRGAFYAYTFFLPRPVFILLGFIILTKDWKKSNSVPLGLFALTNLLIVILEGGDHFAMHRFLLPLLPFLALLTARGVLGMMAQAFASRPALTPSQQTAILAGFCLILTLGQHSRIAIYKNDDHYIFSKGVQWLANESAWAESWKRYWLWLKEKYPPDTLIAVTTA
ncbi:MAG: hypothetical protein RBU29_16120, partial [bacterium]|nr:hypothetical protein [bacterium]